MVQMQACTDTTDCAHITLVKPAGFVACWWLQFVVVAKGSGQVGGGRVRISAIVSTVFPAGWQITWQGSHSSGLR